MGLRKSMLITMKLNNASKTKANNVIITWSI